ncbi:universal stress protein [Pseudonocardia sp. GCM10023141]|uniref:universal stress protein n=1 Tax=Pseudonocardia sp. GCM10023141 TaxID=3252653 RepID=UPI0036243781
MDSYPRVLVGTDGSPDAVAAVHLGATVAGLLAVPLAIVHAVEDVERDSHDGDLLLQEAAAVAAAAGAPDVSTLLAEGKAPQALLALADEEPEQLVVVGAAGLASTTSRLAGSTSNRLTHHSRADVLFVRAPLPQAWNFVALATDGSTTSYEAVRHGLRLAHALDATPRLITAARSQEAGDDVLAAAAAGMGLDGDVEREVLVDPQSASAIVNAGWKYELLAIGNRGMSGPSRLLGSIANTVTHELRTNLLLVNTTRG